METLEINVHETLIQRMSETPRFIALVEQYECLWKKAYRNNLAARRKAWEEVAEKLYGCSWNTFSFSDKKAARKFEITMVTISPHFWRLSINLPPARPVLLLFLSKKA